MGHWPEGVDQRQTLVGSVIRAKPHDGEDHRLCTLLPLSR